MFLAVGAAVIVAGCTPQYIELRPGADDLELCAEVPETVKASVEDLATDRFSGCDMDGVIIVFPDGTEVPTYEPAIVTGVAGVRNEGDIEYTVINLGVDGVFAVMYEPDRLLQWGQPGALELAMERPYVWWHR